MEKLYTVEDIAKITMMTSRTIRNYIKNGMLKGKKIGGQWRFTEGDVNNLMDNGTYRAKHISNLKQDIISFVDGVSDTIKGDVQTCTIIDLYQDRNVVAGKQKELMEFINSNSSSTDNGMRFSSEYIESEAKTRIVIFAQPEFITRAMQILK